MRSLSSSSMRKPLGRERVMSAIALDSIRPPTLLVELPIETELTRRVSNSAMSSDTIPSGTSRVPNRSPLFNSNSKIPFENAFDS